MVRLTHPLLKGALTQAVKWQMIARNPAEYVACRSAGSENSSLRKKVCTMGDVGERMLAELRRTPAPRRRYATGKGAAARAGGPVKLLGVICVAQQSFDFSCPDDSEFSGHRSDELRN